MNDQTSITEKQWLIETYQRFADPVYRFLRYHLQDVAEAEDLTGAVFERILMKASTFDERKGKLEVWIFAIARNLLYDHCRKIRRSRFLPMEAAERCTSLGGRPDEALLINAEAERLHRALGCLNRRERCAVSLRYATGLRITEIARILNVSEKNAGVILTRCRHKLKLEMERLESEGNS